VIFSSNEKLTILYQRIIKEINPNLDQQLTHNDEVTKNKAKYYYERRFKNKPEHFDMDDLVIVRQPKKNKLSSNFKPEPYRIINKNESMITAKSCDSEQIITRNKSHFRKLPESTVFPKSEFNEDEDPVTEINSENNSQEQNMLNRKQYPIRNRRPVQEWRKY